MGRRSTRIWGNEKSRNESQQGFEERMARRRAIEAAREQAEVVERDGEEFVLVRLDDHYELRRELAGDAS